MQYMDYSKSSNAAIARELKRMDEIMKGMDRVQMSVNGTDGTDSTVYEDTRQIVNYLGDRHHELKMVLFDRYVEVFHLKDAFAHEIIDSSEIFEGDHFEEWINKPLTEG